MVLQKEFLETQKNLDTLKDEKDGAVIFNQEQRGKNMALEATIQYQDAAIERLREASEAQFVETESADVKKCGNNTSANQLEQAAHQLKNVFYDGPAQPATSSPGKPDQTAHEEQQKMAIIQRLNSFTPDSFFRDWQDFARNLKTVLEDEDSKPAAEVARELGMLFQQRGALSVASLKLRPDLFSSLISSFIKDPESNVRAEKTAESLNVTAEQAMKLQQAWSDYINRLAASDSLLESARSDLNHVTSDSFQGGLRAMMQEYLKLMNISEDLELHKNEKLGALARLLGAAGQVLDIRQKALICTLSYPNFPDFVLIIYHASQKHRNCIPGSIQSSIEGV